MEPKQGKPLTLRIPSRFYDYVFSDIEQFATFKHHAIEAYLWCQIRGRERLVRRDDEVKDVRGSRRQAGLVLAAADDPAGGLTDHLAVLV